MTFDRMHRVARTTQVVRVASATRGFACICYFGKRFHLGFMGDEPSLSLELLFQWKFPGSLIFLLAVDRWSWGNLFVKSVSPHPFQKLFLRILWMLRFFSYKVFFYFKWRWSTNRLALPSKRGSEPAGTQVTSTRNESRNRNSSATRAGWFNWSSISIFN